MNQLDKIMYGFGFVILGGLFLALILHNTSVLSLQDAGFPCSFQQVTGYPCPGCGGTRAFFSLLSFDVISSFKFHPFVPYTALFFLCYNGYNSFVLLFNKRKTDSRKLPVFHFHTVCFYIGITLIFIHWFISLISVIG